MEGQVVQFSFGMQAYPVQAYIVGRQDLGTQGSYHLAVHADPAGGDEPLRGPAGGKAGMGEVDLEPERSGLPCFIR
ncbi:hypothetical protein AGMMS49942_14840 [Spirochaetia bacterium]|nr:hypothetical protein AGMMS49942_14840 [Spirochaetia bacterium]